MKQLLPLLFASAFAGCLTTSSPELAEWSIPSEAPKTTRATSDFGVARLSQLLVRAPYDIRSLQVLRSDGTLVADPYNHFAAIPSQLLKGPVQDALGHSRRFTAVVGSSSSATVSHTVEVTVTKALLDCSGESSRLAVVELSLLVLDRQRAIVWAGSGFGVGDAKDGDYGSAFAKALKTAIAVAMGEP